MIQITKYSFYYYIVSININSKIDLYNVIVLTYCKMTRMWKDWDLGFGKDIFESIDREFAQAEEMLRVFRTARESGLTGTSFPYYYGYQITVDHDGKPYVREFGNMRPSVKGLVERSNVRKPLVDTVLDQKQNILVITAEMPGLNKDDIKVNIGERFVTIHVEKEEKKYHTEIPVEHELEEDSAKATYTNGILELKLKVKEPPKPKTKEVKVD